MDNALDSELEAVTGTALLIAAASDMKYTPDEWNGICNAVERFLSRGHDVTDLVDTTTDGQSVAVTWSEDYKQFVRLNQFY